MRRRLWLAVLMVLTVLLDPITSYSCTSVLSGKGVTVDGSVILAHNEDMGFLAAGRLLLIIINKGQTLFICVLLIKFFRKNIVLF